MRNPAPRPENPAPSKPRRPSAALLRLIRHLLKSPGPSEADAFAEVLVAQALSKGLATRQGRHLTATPQAKTFLKRALVTGPESIERAFTDQHRDLVSDTVLVDGARQMVSRNLDESPLSALMRLKDRQGAPFFSQAAIDAGERLADDFTRAQLQPRITSSWEPRLSSQGKGRGEAGGMADIAASALEAKARFGRAMEAMGPELSGVAADICCFGKGLELVERERQWPVRSAKLMLRTALMALARHYGPPQKTAASRRSHHWGADDFRPDALAYGITAERGEKSG